MAMLAGKQDKSHVPLKDFYTVEDVSTLLGIGENLVRELANRKIDPLPFRRLKGRTRGMFISRSELAQWVVENTSLVAIVGKSRDGHDEC